MKIELWYKYPNGVITQEKDVVTTNERPDNSAKSGYHLVLKKDVNPSIKVGNLMLSEFLEILWRNDSHQVSKTDLPKTGVLSPALQGLPKTLREIRNHTMTLDIGHYGRVVGQLLASGNATNEECLSLLSSLDSLAQEFEALRRELLKIPADTLRLADEAAAGRT